ncbi:MAG: glycosyltransferase family 2 protein [Bacteroidales bacterium]|nr:glycosyltransferase family 2 protein [Bacteroidales bacterium]
MVRNDLFFAARWMEYYGEHLGPENLFLLIDGHDQSLPAGSENINVLRLPHKEQGRSEGDRNRARLISYLAKSLFLRYDIVIAHDIDEILVIDPAIKQSFREYFKRPLRRASFSALGLDVGQHPEKEEPIDFTRPLLEQRSYAHVSARYTKAVVAARPLIWGSGFHRVKGRNFYIDPNLFLFHFGMLDYNISMEKLNDESLLKTGWEGHLKRRYEIFDLISRADAIEGDDFFERARRRQSLFRPIYAWNKPGMLKEKPIVKIPERFRTVV